MRKREGKRDVEEGKKEGKGAEENKSKKPILVRDNTN